MKESLMVTWNNSIKNPQDEEKKAAENTEVPLFILQISDQKLHINYMLQFATKDNLMKINKILIAKKNRFALIGISFSYSR